MPKVPPIIKMSAQHEEIAKHLIFSAVETLALASTDHNGAPSPASCFLSMVAAVAFHARVAMPDVTRPALARMLRASADIVEYGAQEDDPSADAVAAFNAASHEACAVMQKEIAREQAAAN